MAKQLDWYFGCSEFEYHKEYILRADKPMDDQLYRTF